MTQPATTWLDAEAINFDVEDLLATLPPGAIIVLDWELADVCDEDEWPDVLN